MIKTDANDLFQVRKLDLYMEGHNGFIAGGCFKNIFEKKPFKDIDIFFESENDFNKTLNYFQENDEFLLSYENKNAVCFSKINSKVKIDLVRSIFGTPIEIIKSFDFTVTKFAYYKEETDDGITYKCIYTNKFFEHLITKKLVIDDKLAFPLGTFERSYRYKQYGFGMCRESKAKLIESLQGVSTEYLSMDLYFGFD